MMGNGIEGYWSRVGDWVFPFIAIMALAMVIPWLLIMADAVWPVQVLVHRSRRSPSPLQGESPVDILKKRYLQGEKTKKQFGELKRVPRHKPGNERDESEVLVDTSRPAIDGKF